MASSLESRLRQMSSQPEKSAREHVAQSALHSVRMEGLDVDDDSRRDGAQFIDGRISAGELVDRVVARYTAQSGR